MRKLFYSTNAIMNYSNDLLNLIMDGYINVTDGKQIWTKKGHEHFDAIRQRVHERQVYLDDISNIIADAQINKRTHRRFDIRT
jgi:hypothetical protein